eukprot:4343530-Ditylum_brightwellii.AAC.1
MFICKRGRLDINPGVNYSSTRVKHANKNDWNKLFRMLGFLKETIDDVLILEADDSQMLTCHTDASFAVYADMKSHTGATFTLGKGAISSDSTKQKVNACSTTDSELISVDNKIGK